MKLLMACLFVAVPLASAGGLELKTIDLSGFREGDPPREIFVIDGSIQIKDRKDGKVIEVSGANPEVNAGAVLGPSGNGAAAIEARILASKARRSFPRFGIGVHGQTGFRLLVVPARRELHLVRGEAVIKTAGFEWKSGAPVTLRLAFSPAGAGKWTVSGKAWAADNPEPSGAQIIHEMTGPAPRGQCSIWATPYAGTPVEFDRIKVGVGG